MTDPLSDSTPDPTPDPTPLAPPAGFEDTILQLGVAFDPGDIERLGRFLALLLVATEQFNLTAVRDPRAAWRKHILDSLTLLPRIATLEASTVLDVGSGGGVPGLPLALVMPEVRFTLLEATDKKVRFLEQTVTTLGLTNVTVVGGRAETVAHEPAHRAAYDLVIARALGPLPTLVELTAPFARVGGRVLAVKGDKAAREVRDAHVALKRLHLVERNRERTPTSTIVELEKIAPTPKRYPRRPGEPKRAPL